MWVYAGVLNQCVLLQMARAEEVEDIGRLNNALPEAEVNPVVAEAEVDPRSPPETGEGSLAAPASTMSGGGSSPAPAPMAELAAEDPMAAAGSSQVA